MASFKIPSSPCLASALPLPTLCGAEILSLQASPIANLSSTIPGVAAVIPAFCNITVTYTHTGQDDTINVETWLPFQNYIGRLQAVGGGGWNAGRVPSSYVQAEMAVMQGYATMTTDAGLGWANDTARGPSAWALENSGQVNINLLQDLASVSLNDEAVIANDLINSFYGQPPDFSYWNGCSQGGRQGLMLAQRFPDVYDGILACAPAINWAELFPASIWPAVFMQLTSQFPHSCELDYLTNASVAACDGDDGVLDGIIADPDQCSFNPFSMVGQSFNCSQEGATMHLSHAAASVANATWGGPRSSTGEFLWYGPDMGADITGDTYGLGVGIAATTCSSNGTCVPAISDLYAPWIPLFIEKDPSFNQLNLTHEAYDSIFHASIQQYESIISTNDPDLSAFRDNDGKMITWHGLASPHFFFFTARAGSTTKVITSYITDRRHHPV